MASKPAITVLGTGAMGSRMAANYATAGYSVTVWNRSAVRAKQLAQTCDVTVEESFYDARSSADVVVSMLADDESIQLLGKLRITAPKIGEMVAKFAERSLEPNFPVKLVAKDLDYPSRLSDKLDASSPLSAAAAAMFTRGATADVGELDISGIAQLYLTN